MIKFWKNKAKNKHAEQNENAHAAPSDSPYWRTDDIRIRIDKAAVKHFERYRFAAEKLSRFRVENVLDIACGSGYGSWIIAGKGIEVLGMDIETEVIEYGNRTYKNDFVEYKAGDAANIELEDKVFDAVVSFETIEHIDNPAKAIEECRRVLKDGGYYIFSIPINHPDTVYHKKIYSVDDAKSLIESFEWKEIKYFYQEETSPYIVENIDIITTIIGICRK